MPRISRNSEEQEILETQGRDYLEILARGLRVLMAFSEMNRHATMADLAKQLELSRATVRRILFTLESMGFVESDGRIYRLTPRILLFSKAYLSSSTIPTVMQPIVERVATSLGENCSAAVLDGLDAVFVARSTPARIISIGLEIGFRLPAYASAIGRVLLGGLSNDDLDVRLEQIHPEKLTQQTIVDKEELRAAIIMARAQGYSVVDEEAERGFRSVAVPVVRYDGKVVSALHIGVHVERASIGHMVDHFVPILRAAAEEAGAMLI